MNSILSRSPDISRLKINKLSKNPDFFMISRKQGQNKINFPNVTWENSESQHLYASAIVLSTVWSSLKATHTIQSLKIAAVTAKNKMLQLSSTKSGCQVFYITQSWLPRTSCTLDSKKTYTRYLLLKKQRSSYWHSGRKQSKKRIHTSNRNLQK